MEHYLHLAAQDIGQCGREPRYGTWTISTAAIILNNSPETWYVDPLPAEAMLSLPGLALA